MLISHPMLPLYHLAHGSVKVFLANSESVYLLRSTKRSYPELLSHIFVKFLSYYIFFAFTVYKSKKMWYNVNATQIQ